MMNLPSMFKTKKPRPYSYIPRYYDARKEELSEIEKRGGKGVGFGMKTEHVAVFRKNKIGSMFKQQQIKSGKRSNIRFLIIIAALFLLSFWFLFS